MFAPRLALASLSGESDADWAEASVQHAGGAFLGGIAIDEPTREAAREMVDRDREEFLPEDPVAWVDDQLAELDEEFLRPGVNVRTTSLGPLREVAGVCADHDAVLEVNAHCRQGEMCAAGAGESLLRDPDALAAQVAAAAPATTSVKVRAEVGGVNLGAVARAASDAGADWIHVDAMDTPGSVTRVAAAAPDLAVVGNNGVRDAETARRYLDRGAAAVSVGRPTTDPDLLARVATAVKRACRAPEGQP